MKKFLILYFILLSAIYINADQTDDSIKSKISKTKIKLGEKITLNISIPGENFKEYKIVWGELNSSNGKSETISQKDSYINKTLHLEIVFTFYEAGTFKDFTFTVPISIKDQEMMYLTTDKYEIEVSSPLTDEELENIKKIKDPSKIELKKEKLQEKMPFIFSGYIKIILIVLLIILIGLILYYIVYKMIFKNREGKIEQNKLSPYENFLAKLEIINFDKNDDRKTIELKLSELTEIVKELIFLEFALNAPSETTKELIYSLRNINFENNLILSIKSLLEEIDMIKFAKASYDFDRLIYQKEAIRKLGNNIHQYNLDLIKKSEVEKQKELENKNKDKN